MGVDAVPRRELRHEETLADGLQRLDDEAVDVVLLDLGLPDSRGIPTLETVRDHSRTTPIVVLTGLSDESVGVRAVQQGAQEYLNKDELTPTLLARSLRHAIERKKFERTRAALHSASRDLIQAESKTEVSRLAVDTALDVLDVPGIVVSLFDDSDNVLEPVAHTDYAEELFGGVPSFGPEDTALAWRAFVTGETMTSEDAAGSEDAHRGETPLRSGLWVPLSDHGVITVASEEPGGFDQQTRQLADHLAATAEAALGRVEREESLREHEHELTRQNRQLEDLNRMNELIREIDQALVRATTRDEIEEAVCELLTRDERFAFAWIGEAVDGGVLRPRTRAGTDRGYLDAVSLRLDADDGPPAVTAAATESVSLAPNVAADLRSGAWRQAALACDLQSVIGVPLTYNELSYGVLTVYAADPKTFPENSRDVFAELGATIANAMNSIETRQALLTDTVVELELAVRESDDVLVRLAAGADCEVEYGGLVPQSDGTDRIFFTASGGTAGAIRTAAEDVPSIRQLARIGDGDAAESRFEMTVSGDTILSTIVECGAVARSVRAAASEIRAVVELPNSADVRTFVNRFEATYPETELVARRDEERGDQSQQAFESALTDELTDRQLEALRTAYHSGYFEWPRERTGEEVAESLDITQPTLNGHLRSAERKLCAMLFAGTSPSD